MNIQRIAMVNYSNKKTQTNIYANNKLYNTNITFCAKNRLPKNGLESLIDIEAELKPEKLQEVQTKITSIKEEAAEILKRVREGNDEGLKVRQLQDWIDSLTISVENDPVADKTFEFSNGSYTFFDYKEREKSSLMLKRMFGIGNNGNNGTSWYTEITKDNIGNTLTIRFDFDTEGKLKFVDKHINNQNSGTVGCQVDLSKETPKFETYSYDF